MEEQEDMEFNSSHKYIKNTYTNGTVLPGHLLNTGITKIPERTKDISTQLGQKKKKKDAEAGQDQCPREGAEGEESVAVRIPSVLERQTGDGSIFRALEESKTDGLCQAGQRHTKLVCVTPLCPPV